ncbi:hypothetical protein MMC28_007909 [Mycoblastus sanguinarius]|nr:hypothetical protein [Mycoblastus sanguinarius]
MEDTENKPWRPIPAGRLTAEHARKYIETLHAVTIGTSLIHGGVYPCLALHLLTFCYNDLGSGETWALRNFTNAGGYLCFITGAMQVAVGSQCLDYSQGALKWLSLTTSIISTTMQTQDLYDQEGDKLRGRMTIPLVFGDLYARYSIAVPVAVWSFVAPAFWHLDIFGFILPMTVGSIVVMRLLDKSRRKVKDDKRTFMIWNIWIISLYLLPLWAHFLKREVQSKT